MTPKFTIGIPCYNAAGSIKAAIESALAQTCGSHEVIVVDDGSSDATALAASAFGDRIRLFRTGRRGGNHARNVIMHEAYGEWVQYLDADDLLEPQKIEKQLEEVGDTSEVDVIYSPVWIETAKGEEWERTVSESSPDRDLFSQWLAWHLPQTGGCLWRRSALLDIAGWREDQLCCQEHELYFRSLREGQRWRFAPTPGAIYRIWSETTVCRKDPALVIRVKTHLMDSLRRWMESQKLWKPEHAEIAGRACFEMARTLARFDREEAVKYHRSRQERGLIRLEGPAAPPFYRTVYNLLGFRAAETIAAATR